MLDRSEMSFIFLWVINPIVILFYQNCSSIPQNFTDSKMNSSKQIVQEFTRTPACRQSECAEPIN